MNGDTRLSEAIKDRPAILDYIISLNPHDFERLRSPVLNKVMPPRITLRRLAAMVGIPESDFVASINELAGIAAESGEPSISKPVPKRAEELPVETNEAFAGRRFELGNTCAGILAIVMTIFNAPREDCPQIVVCSFCGVVPSVSPSVFV
jgi:hypothetical protein